MEFFKCNIYILGNRIIGRNFFRRELEELIHFERNQFNDKFNGEEWIIRTENNFINVQLKEYYSFEFPNFEFNSQTTKNIILYIIDEDKSEFSIPPKDIQFLKCISNNATIIVASPSLNPFVEYFIPIYEFHYQEMDKLSQIVVLTRQIIINSTTSALKHAKELIKKNFESKHPTLDLGCLGLTSLNEVKEVFQNTHLETLILSNEWGEYIDGSWIRQTSDNKHNPNTLFRFPKEIASLKNLKTLIAGGNWKQSKKTKLRYFSPNWYITDLKPLSSLKKLSVLNLSNNEIETTIPLSSLSSLTKIYLNNNSIKIFPNINKYPRLRS